MSSTEQNFKQKQNKRYKFSQPCHISHPPRHLPQMAPSRHHTLGGPYSTDLQDAIFKATGLWGVSKINNTLTLDNDFIYWVLWGRGFYVLKAIHCLGISLTFFPSNNQKANSELIWNSWFSFWIQTFLWKKKFRFILFIYHFTSMN